MPETANSGATTRPTGAQKQMNFREHILLMARYNRWAQERLLATLRPLPDDLYHRECGIFFHSIHGTLNHLLVADQLWFGRFTGSPVAGLRPDSEICAGRDILAD
ncbi:MAG: DinB family protein [Acidiferrobacterales bacterium]